jgi:hypothetical protein
MSDFVEECRREWKRLRVPAPSANEMADDLSADLQEAEQEGAFPEEVLGDAAKDPRAFAEAWARERGLVQPRFTDRLRGRPALIVALALLGVVVVVALIAAALLVGRDTSNGALTRSAVTSEVSTLTPRFNGVVGTSVRGATLMPGKVSLPGGLRTRRVVAKPPTALTATVANSGEAAVEQVTVVLQIAGHRSQRIVRITKGSVRRVQFALPKHLPSSFTISVRTLAVAGEHNLSNNRATWRIRVRG